jgi:hypothetical protein
MTQVRCPNAIRRIVMRVLKKEMASSFQVFFSCFRSRGDGKRALLGAKEQQRSLQSFVTY